MQHWEEVLMAAVVATLPWGKNFNMGVAKFYPVVLDLILLLATWGCSIDGTGFATR
tara:strand:+ start:371 stop:538 length:168 start_codon:yes stop_codon:yes gene_type:complete